MEANENNSDFEVFDAIETVLRAHGFVEFDQLDPSWSDLRSTWDDRLSRVHPLRRAGIGDPEPLVPFERAAVLLSAFSSSEVADLVFDLGLEGREHERQWLEPALASLLFSEELRPTVRPWELMPEGDPDALDRAYRAIDRGTVLMGSPMVFVDEDALWVLDDSILFRAYGTLSELLARLKPVPTVV